MPAASGSVAEDRSARVRSVLRADALPVSSGGHPGHVLGWFGSTAVRHVPADDRLVQPWTPAGSLRAAVDVARLVMCWTDGSS